jgi:hypothetical protein
MKTTDKSNPRVKTPFDSTFCLLPSAIAVTDVQGRVDHVKKQDRDHKAREALWLKY